MRLRHSAFLGAAVTAGLILSVAVWMRVDPQFGGVQDPARLARHAKSPQWREGRFQNQLPTPIGLEKGNRGELIPMIWEFFTAEVPDKEPAEPLPVVPVGPGALADRDTALDRATWFGHSSLLLETGGRKILFDPNFEAAASPIPFSPPRFDPPAAFAAADIPPLDAVVITHDHFDHLDLEAVRALAGRTGRFLVPLGVGAHLERWGIPASQVVELDWGDTAAHAGLSFICAPARHFSGRRLTDSFRTLWASWIVIAGDRRYFHSGDSGYGPHFGAIGAAHGPFDAGFFDCGQYNERWAAVHMNPEEAVRAAREAGAKLVMPIHWGAFALAMHPWYEPAARLAAAARKEGIPAATPRLGETVDLRSADPPDEPWWEAVPKENGKG